jgi:hypothetical protein
VGGYYLSVQRGVAILFSSVNVGPLLQKQPNQNLMPFSDGSVQRRVVYAIRYVDISHIFQEQLHHRSIPLTGRLV